MQRALYLLLFVMLIPCTGRAAAVDLWIEPVNFGQAPYAYTLRLDVEAGVRVTGLDFVLVGFTSMQLDPTNLDISGPDSVFRPGVVGDERASVVINTVPGGALAAGPATSVLVATFFTPTSVHCDLPGCATPLEFHDNPAYFGGTVFGDSGVITDYELHLWAVRHVPDAPVPAPHASVLCALTLSALALSRRLRLPRALRS